MQERNVGWHLALVAMVIAAVLCAGIYYYAFTLPPIESPPTLTPSPEVSPTPTHLPPTLTPFPIETVVTPTPTATLATPPAATATPLPIRTVIKTSTPASRATAAPDIAPTATAEACQIAANEIYIIQPGDSMWKIAGCAFGEPFQWIRICAANPQVSDCHWIHAGNSLVIPRAR